MRFNFEWDPKKAAANLRKHGISFELAASIFKDPNAISIFDEDHSGEQDRWTTLGIAASGAILVVHHTFTTVGSDMVMIRLFSSRKATGTELRQYAG